MSYLNKAIYLFCKFKNFKIKIICEKVTLTFILGLSVAFTTQTYTQTETPRFITKIEGIKEYSKKIS